MRYMRWNVHDLNWSLVRGADAPYRLCVTDRTLVVHIWALHQMVFMEVLRHDRDEVSILVLVVQACNIVNKGGNWSLLPRS
jgi:hypothetical protein